MIFGFIDVTDKAVSTHRDSYLLHTISVVSVRRPILGGALLMSAGALGFAASFADLLYVQEIAALVGGSLLALITGVQVGQLKLVSRELNDNPLADVIWGRYAILNSMRLKIAGRMEELGGGGDL